MFETFNAPAFYLGNCAVLALYASGRTTGLSVDCGHGSTDFVPVYEGYALSHSMLRIDVGGDEITGYLGNTLGGNSFSPDIFEDMKEKHCYVAPDFDSESQRNVSYELPDGQLIDVGAGSFQASEVLFQPMMIGLDVAGIHQQAYVSTMKCDSDIRRDLYANVVLSGGTSMLPGITDRLHRELTHLIPQTTKLNVVAPPNRQYSTWVGGTTLASLSTFQEMWISKEEYDEQGAGVVNRKCY